MAEKKRPWWKEVPAREPQPEAEAPDDGDGSAAEAGPAVAADDDLADGESRQVQGSGAKPYVLKNTGGVYSCSCPAWMHQGVAIERRTCKHLRALRGDAAEDARVGSAQSGAAEGGSRTVRAATPGVAPPILLAHSWTGDTDLGGWWMSEKLDGVRAYWDGERLLTRLGNEVAAPSWFVEALPRGVALDGELFGGRKRFQETVSVVRRQDRSDAWRALRYVLFDAPRHEGAFEARLAAVRDHVRDAAAAHLVAHPHEACRDVAHLREELARVEALGGEGLMLRKPGSRYEIGRSFTLLKVKTFHDAEARVRAHLPGTGKHKGRLGALQCELPDGTLFSVGTGFSDAERKAPPPVGAIVTFRYQELSRDGVPRFPSYVGVRHDVAWPPAAAARARPPAAAPDPRAAPAPAPAALAEGRAARVFVQNARTWEIRLDGPRHVVRRASGESVEATTTTFSSAAAAWRDADRKIAERLAEGYVEVPDDD